jgi:hypothetical protein
MSLDNIFNFEIIPVDRKLEIWNSELYSAGRWDNLFYRGQFLQNELNYIRCIDPCRNCYKSFFNISFLDFNKNELRQLVKDNYLTNEIIKEKGLAQISELGQEFIYDIKIEATANYVQVKCKSCNTKHFLVLGITETQPGLYGGQLHGVWRIKE